MASRNLRIDAAPATVGASQRDRVSPVPWATKAPSLMQHLRATNAATLVLQFAVQLLTLLLVRGAYALLSSTTVSCYFALLLLVTLALTAAALYPDKLAVGVAGLTALLGLLWLGYWAGLYSSRCFLLLSGLVGVVCSLGLNLLSVYSGAAVSQRAQELCFLLSLSTTLLGSLGQLLLPCSVSGPSASASCPRVYLYGVLLSTAAAMFNLLCNKRFGSVAGAASGGFIAGRDDEPGAQRSMRPSGLQTDDDSSSGMETPVVVSPAQQYRQRLKL